MATTHIGYGMTATGNAGKCLSVSAEELSGWVRSAVGDKSHDFKDFARQHFNNYMRTITGQTVNSINTWTPKTRRRGSELDTTQWYVRPGVGIRGRLNYLAKWIGTEKEFMRPMYNSWVNMAQVPEYVAQAIEGKWNDLTKQN